MSSWDDLVAIIRREVHHVMSQHQRQTIMVCTAYNPDTHAVKGILMPNGVESGWVPIGTVHTADGSGHFVGPKVGSADAMDGDQFEMSFENGNPNTPIAKPIMSIPDKPPKVESGEVLTVAKGADDGTVSSTYYKKDGSVEFTHYKKQGTHTWDADGNITTDTKGATHTIKTSGGMLTVDSGGADMHIKSSGGMLHLND